MEEREGEIEGEECRERTYIIRETLQAKKKLSFVGRLKARRRKKGEREGRRERKKYIRERRERGRK